VWVPVLVRVPACSWHASASAGSCCHRGTEHHRGRAGVASVGVIGAGCRGQGAGVRVRCRCARVLQPLLPPLVRSFFLSCIHFCLRYVFFSLFSCACADALPPSLPGAQQPPLAHKCNWGGGGGGRFVLLPQAHPFPCSLLFATVCLLSSSRLFASLAGDEEGILPHPYSSLFACCLSSQPRLLMTKRVASPLPPLVRGFLICLACSFLSLVCPSLISHTFLLISSPPLPGARCGPLSLANMTWVSICSPPSDSPFPCSPPSLVPFICPACASVAGDEEGVWPHPLSHPCLPSFPPLFILVRPCSPRSLATNWVASPPLACKHEWGVDLAAVCPSPLVCFFSFSHFSLTQTTS
jgi:hypothetical protein